MNIPVNIYLGQFMKEKKLFSMKETDYIPNKNDFIYHNETCYKVLYLMHDTDNDELSVFVREAVDEDF